MYSFSQSGLAVKKPGQKARASVSTCIALESQAAHLPHQATVRGPQRHGPVAVPLLGLRLHVDVALRPGVSHGRRHPGTHPASERHAGAGREVRGEVGDAGQERGARGRGARVGEERGEVRSCVRLVALWVVGGR